MLHPLPTGTVQLTRVASCFNDNVQPSTMMLGGETKAPLVPIQYPVTCPMSNARNILAIPHPHPTPSLYAYSRTHIASPTCRDPNDMQLTCHVMAAPLLRVVAPPPVPPDPGDRLGRSHSMLPRRPLERDAGRKESGHARLLWHWTWGGCGGSDGSGGGGRFGHEWLEESAHIGVRLWGVMQAGGERRRRSRRRKDGRRRRADRRPRLPALRKKT
mmetsp:Transcript_22415/g.50656  ORF Transcript_22415/g.50656 Transcript_22415/m.50656 type:complete len:215 (-) Transcript_22415:511-1155(-)